MAPKVKIVTDSSAYLAPEVISKYDIHIVPLRVAFGADMYTEGVDITPEGFYQRLAGSHVFPSTSQPPIGEFTQAYGLLAQQGHPILSIHISSKLSGTVSAALATRKTMPQAQIEVVDSLSIAMGMLVAPAAEAAERGYPLPQIRESIEKLNRRLNTVGAFSTLEYLRRGGRIGAAKALLGTLLGIKPVLTYQNGNIKVLARPRTMPRAVEYMLQFVQRRARRGASIHGWITHGHVYETALTLEKELHDRLNWAELRLFELGPVLGTHLGPGFIGLAFYSDEDWELD